MIDTPGEYLERRYFRGAPHGDGRRRGHDCAGPGRHREGEHVPARLQQHVCKALRGVVTKSDLASEHEISNARQYLKAAGAGEIFVVSSVTGEGVEALVRHLDFL